MKAQVYVMRGPDALKIGFSKDPETRLAALRPDGAIEVLSAVEVLDARAVEAAAHSLLVEKRKKVANGFSLRLRKLQRQLRRRSNLSRPGSGRPAGKRRSRGGAG